VERNTPASDDPRSRPDDQRSGGGRSAVLVGRPTASTCVERDDVSPLGDDPANLNGHPITLRYAWRDPSTLLPAEHPTLLPR